MSQASVKRSTFRQRGYLLKSTNEYVIIYGEGEAPAPVNGEPYFLAWDNTVTNETKVVSNLGPHEAIQSS